MLNFSLAFAPLVALLVERLGVMENARLPDADMDMSLDLSKSLVLLAFPFLEPNLLLLLLLPSPV